MEHLPARLEVDVTVKYSRNLKFSDEFMQELQWQRSFAIMVSRRNVPVNQIIETLVMEKIKEIRADTKAGLTYDPDRQNREWWEKRFGEQR